MNARVRWFARQSYKLGLYFLVPALGALAPLLVIPAVTAQYGANGWATVAIATSLGGGAAVLAELGWGVVGPQRVAKTPHAAVLIYEQSLASKLLSVAVLGPVAAVLAAVLAAPYEFSLGAALIAFGSVGGVLSPGWFFIGKGRPLMVLLTDTIPKVGVAVIAAVAISRGAPLEIYGGGILLSAMLGYGLATWLGKLPPWPSTVGLGMALRLIKDQLVVIVGRGISTLYTTLPTAILGVVNVDAVASFSAVDRLMRMGLNLLTGVPARLQSWIARPTLSEGERRSRISIGINVCLGLLSAVVYVLIAPLVVEVLFSGTVRVDWNLIFLSGVLAALICSSRGLGLALVAAGQANLITVAVTISASVGVTLLVVLGHSMGATGAVAALVLAETTGVVAQLVMLRRTWRRQRSY